MTHAKDAIGYPIDPELRRLEFRLGDLAAQWRGSYSNPVRQDHIVHEYNAILAQLYEAGWESVLDVESELPDQLILKEYLHRNGR